MVVETGKADSASEYGDIRIDEKEQSAVSSDLVFDVERMHLYAMTKSTVTSPFFHPLILLFCCALLILTEVHL